MTLEKRHSVEDTNGNGVTDAGDVVSYTFDVTNTGTLTVGGVTIADEQLGVSELGIGQDTLAPGETVSVPAPGTHTITFADMERGEYVNTATVDAAVPGRDDVPVTGGEDEDTVDVQASDSQILLNKTARLGDSNGNRVADLGEEVSYEFTVTNTGNVPLSDIVVSDEALGIEGLEIPGTLAPGDTSDPVPAGATHTITEEDILAGEYVNTATVTSAAPEGSGIADPTDDSSATVDTAAPQGALELEKSAELNDANNNGVADAGETIDYSFAVTNTGNVTLTGVTVDDEKLGVAGLEVDDLEPGQSRTVAAPEAYTVTEADTVRGSVLNNATVAGELPEGAPGEDPVAGDENSVPTAEANGSLNLVKSHADVEDTNGNGVTDAGDEVSYSFEVTNNGNVTLRDVVIDDERLGLAGLEVGELEPGESRTVDAPEPYVLTDADVMDGSVVNEASATGTPPDGVPAPTAEDTDTVETVEASAGVSIEKVATVEDTNDNGVTDAGDVVSYEFRVTNNGTISVGGVSITDEKLGVADLGIGQDTLAPGETVTVDAPETHTLTFADMEAGEYVNTATVEASVPGNEDFEVAPGEDENTVDVQGSNSEILLNKIAELDDANDNGVADLGEEITYSFTATNTGNVPLTDVVVTDEALGIDGLTIPGTLAPGETSEPVEAGASHTITEADVIAGDYTNVASVTSKAPEGSGIEDPSDDSQATVDTAAPAGTLSLDKAAELNDANGNGVADAGETIGYSFEVTNTGNVTLDGIVVDDAKLGLSGLEVGTLAPGESRTVQAPEAYTVTEADVIAGKVVNAATATGELPDGVENVPNPTAGDDTTTPTVTPHSAVSLEKAAELADTNGNGLADAGETIGYSFEVTNTGNVTLDGLVVNDAKLGISGLEVGTLAPGESRTVRAPGAYEVTADDVRAGSVANTATASGNAPDGSGLPDPDGSDTVETEAGEIPAPEPTENPTPEPPGPGPDTPGPDPSDPGTPGPDPDAPDDGGRPGDGDLPRTGADVIVALLAGAALILGGGLLLLFGSRRRGDDEA